MLIWLILIASFVAGIVVTITGKLNTSKRRHIIGRNARIVGVGMIALLPVVLFVTVSGTAFSLWLGSSPESADTYGNIAGVSVLSVIAIGFAANVKRLSVPMRTGRPSIDLLIKPSVLEDPKASNPTAPSNIDQQSDGNPYTPPRGS
jgi:hypothetical protein